VLEKFSWSVLTMLSRVNGQRLATSTAAQPATTRANNPLILIQRNSTLDFPYLSIEWIEISQSGTLNGLREPAEVSHCEVPRT
jgi:hypothetical protein